MDFLNARTTYNNCREEEKNKIIQRLKKEGYQVTPYFKGRGVPNYTSNGNMQKEHDLRLWKWIEVDKQGKCCCISLQAFDNSNADGNRLVLFDRIGIYGPYKTYDPEKCFTNMSTTEIELPMDENKYRQLVDLLDKKCTEESL